MRPTYDELVKKNALLEASLREIIRITDEIAYCRGCISPEEAYEEQHFTQWKNIIQKSRSLLV